MGITLDQATGCQGAFRAPDRYSRLEAVGEDGMSAGDLAATGLFEVTAHLPQVLATGEASDVYLCHPFLVHTAQRHRGTWPSRRCTRLSSVGLNARMAGIRPWNSLSGVVWASESPNRTDAG